MTPRGRYDVKFFTDFVDLHGKTFDYKISYDHIQRLFLLPHKDGRQMYFVIAIDPPMKQGNTRYPFLIVLFNIEEEASVDLTISEYVLTPVIWSKYLIFISNLVLCLVKLKRSLVNESKSWTRRFEDRITRSWVEFAELFWTRGLQCLELSRPHQEPSVIRVRIKLMQDSCIHSSVGLYLSINLLFTRQSLRLQLWASIDHNRVLDRSISRLRHEAAPNMSLAALKSE